MGIKLSEIARVLGAEVQGDENLEISGVGGLGDAKAGDIIFLESASLLDKALSSSAAALIVPLEVTECSKPFIRTENPRLSFVKVLELFEPAPQLPPGIHPTAIVGKGVQLGRDVAISAYCYIGDGCILEDKAMLYPNCYVGPECVIGANTILFPRATLYAKVRLGKNCRINSGAVIGSEGFGYVPENGRYRRMPQLGQVIIGDDVDIGANTTIDRSTTGGTIIGRGTKIDNLVHIAHNVSIGEDCCICGQVGISGSVKIGDRVVLAGQAGLKDHIKIGSDVMVGAQGGVISDIPDGVVYSGYPARPHAEQMRVHAAQRRLPQLIKEWRQLKNYLQKKK